MWLYILVYVVFFFKQKTAYEMRISDWSSDVCSSDLSERDHIRTGTPSDCRTSGQQCRPPPAILPRLRGREHHHPKLQRRGSVTYTASIEGQVGQAGILRQIQVRVTNLKSRRSEERRVGQECVRTCRSGGSSYHKKKK